MTAKKNGEKHLQVLSYLSPKRIWDALMLKKTRKQYCYPRKQKNKL